MSPFAELKVLDSAGPRCLRAGVGAPVVVLQTEDDFGPQPFHDLLAEQCEVTLAAAGSKANSPEQLGDLIRSLGYDSCSIVCDAGTSATGLCYALSAQDSVARLVLKAPEVTARREYGALSLPVLVIESSKVQEGHTGQELAAVIPNCFHILVYDASESLSSDRTEAVVDLVSDFIDRGARFVVSKPHGVIHP